MDMGSFTYPGASPAVVSARQLASVPFLLRGGGGWRKQGDKTGEGEGSFLHKEKDAW